MDAELEAMLASSEAARRRWGPDKKRPPIRGQSLRLIWIDEEVSDEWVTRGRWAFPLDETVGVF